MKILHVIPGLASRMGGTAVSVVESSVALDAVGVETTIFATDMANAASGNKRELVRPEGLPAGADALDVRLFPARAPYRFAFSPALDRELARHVGHYDVVHIHSLFLFPQFAAFRRAQGANRPYLVSPHGALDPWLRKRGRLRKAATSIIWQRRMLDRAAMLHLMSQEEARLIADIAPGVPRAIVPIGIAWARYQSLPDPSAFRRVYLGGDDGPTILNLGRLSHKKGLDILIRAFALVSQQVPEARLVIAGPDDENLTPCLAAIAAEAGVSRNVSFVGMLTGDDKLGALAAADVWALPSHTENFGVAVVEALAAGLPVVISPAVNIAPEIVEADAGSVCPQQTEALAAELLRLVSNPAERARLGRQARAFARRFDWGEVAPQLIAMYEQAAAA